MPIAAAAWVTGIPASIRRHSKSRPAGVNRALRCIEPPLARGLFSDSHTRPEAQLIGGPRQQRPWALQLVLVPVALVEGVAVPVVQVVDVVVVRHGLVAAVGPVGVLGVVGV